MGIINISAFLKILISLVFFSKTTKTRFLRFTIEMRCYIFVFGILLGLLSPMKLIAQQIDFRCTQVNAAENIILNWQSTGIPIGYQYEIYRSESKTGTYTLITTITNLSILTYTDATVTDGGTKQYFYTIKAVPTPPFGGLEYNSDTIGNIFFVLYPPLGVALLEWRHPSTPPLPTQSQTFDIYKERAGVWDLWDTCSLLRYNDTIHVCGDTLAYEIRLYDSIGCESISIIRIKPFSDNIAPSTPQLDSVSINPVTGKTELGWNPSPDPDVVGYIIYIHTGIWEVVDTVMGANSTYYLDNNNDANGEIQKYRIAAIDTCRNSSPMGDSTTTILLNDSTDKCDSLVFLSWNAYINMPDGLTGYRIWVSKDGGAFVLLDTVSSGLQSYTHRGVDPMSNYTYYVQAYNLKNGYSSSSSKKDVVFNRVVGSGDVWMRYVSVVDNNYLEIVVFVPDTVAFNDVLLFRAEKKGGFFSHIDSKAKITGQENYIFTDYNVNVHQNTYYYVASITDECDDIFVSSDTANNIVLQEKGASSNDDISIEWEPYDGFRARLDSYDIFRRTQMEVSLQYIDNVLFFQLDYSENIWSSASQGGKFYYQVCANEDNSNIYGFQDKSYSNIVELVKEPTSYIPNLFSPNSNIPENRVFKPVHLYVDAEEYLFCIYDRWGSIIFRTTDITAGWDGSANGQVAMAGAYTYYITYRIDKKNIFKKQGTVTLIR